MERKESIIYDFLSLPNLLPASIMMSLENNSYWDRSWSVEQTPITFLLSWHLVEVTSSSQPSIPRLTHRPTLGSGHVFSSSQTHILSVSHYSHYCLSTVSYSITFLEMMSFLYDTSQIRYSIKLLMMLSFLYHKSHIHILSHFSYRYDISQYR